MAKQKIIKLIVFSLIFTFSITELFSVRIKDIATIEGVSGVQVIGYGLVTGLNQSGDNQLTSFTVQSVSNMLKRFGLTIPRTNPRVKNVAAVMVTTTIPTFLRKGSKVDVQVSSIGDASSLQGGVLIMSPLSKSDGTIIGMAQGAVSVGGYDFRALGSRVEKNFVTTGRVPNGLILTDSIGGTFAENQLLRIVLRDPDFTTAYQISNVINSQLGSQDAAVPLDAATIQVKLPEGGSELERMKTISDIESLQVNQINPVARVVINERTGTIVIGGNVELLPAVVAHGGLEITIQRQVIVPQQAPFTLYPPRHAVTATIVIEEEINRANPLAPPPITQPPTMATIKDMADALNLLEVTPRDLISIFQALKEAGSLLGELIIQ